LEVEEEKKRSTKERVERDAEGVKFEREEAGGKNTQGRSASHIKTKKTTLWTGGVKKT